MKRRDFIKNSSLLIFVGAINTNLFAHAKNIDFRSVEPEKAEILQKIKNRDFCYICGMKLSKFYKTNHAAKANGEIHQYCSIRCMVYDALQNGSKPVEPLVVDTINLNFIDAQKAFYVYGSTMPATMTKISSYGFLHKDEAVKFKDKFGGKILNYDEIYLETKALFSDDLSQKREKMMHHHNH
ncbi:hypothetical protein F1B92_00245 [Campylobacter sp. FMV-PI01]|uniref:Nitrous oxide reductase accessory protein NosL n=1 Tax=Campylobacter portucalensis TaxID=2608384 RepID=A0A6L5WIU7_9BACT|nr:nitrous oxide reductase accessory protein NosL [Campylobacter portucalensis]MSN95641.1 hypothetical protein [Campylobacter portucalensis]